MTTPSKPARLKELLNSGRLIPLPGSFDALSAKLTERAGFEAGYVSGYAVTATRLALPDVGQLSMAENLANTAAITAVTSIPLIVDIDTGYGNAVTVMRTIREFERIGVAGVDIDDSAAELCPHLPMPRQVISAEEMAGKIRAAVATRQDPNLCIIPKISLKGTEYEANGTIFDEFRRRVERYAEAGADGITVGSQVPAELEKYARAVRDVGLPPVGVAIAFRETPPCDQLEQLGFAAMIYAIDTLYASIQVQTEVLAAIRRNGDIPAVRDRFADHDDVMDIVGVPEIREASERFLINPALAN
jgi:2,3-dimethylmalate lyase